MMYLTGHKLLVSCLLLVTPTTHTLIHTLTVIREILLLKYFRGASQPRKLNARKFLYDEKLQRRRILHVAGTPPSRLTRVAAV